MTRITHIDSCRIWMDHFQSRILRVQPLLPFLAFLAVIFPLRKRSNVDTFRFAMAYSLLLRICQARLSWRLLHNLSGGVELAFSGRLATKQ